MKIPDSSAVLFTSRGGYTALALIATASLAPLVSASAQTTIYLNPTQAATNNALSTANSWWTDAAGTTAFAGTVSTSTNILAFNNLVTSAVNIRTGGGSGGSLGIYGFQVLDPGAAITVPTANNASQTVTLNGAVGIDMSTATQDFTFKAGSDTNPSFIAFLRIATAAPATTAWKVNTGRTLTIGSTTWNTNNVPNTSVTAQSTGKTLQLVGNGTTAMGDIVFNANVGSNSLAVQIDGTGTSTSGGNVYFNGTSNALGSLSITNATATFASVGTTAGTVTVNSTGALAGAGTFSGVTTVNGNLNPGSNTAAGTLNFGNGLTLGGTSTVTLNVGGTTATDIDLINVTAGTLSLDGTFSIASINSFNGTTAGSYNLLDFTTLSGNFTSVTAFGSSLTYDNVSAWTGVSGGTTYSFSLGNGVLTVTAVPEPGAYAIAVGGFAMLLCLQRRMRRNQGAASHF